MEKLNKIGNLNYVKKRVDIYASVKTKLENDGNLHKDIKPGPKWIGMILSVRSSVWTNTFNTKYYQNNTSNSICSYNRLTVILQKHQKNEEHLENDILLL